MYIAAATNVVTGSSPGYRGLAALAALAEQGERGTDQQCTAFDPAVGQRRACPRCAGRHV